MNPIIPDVEVDYKLMDRIGDILYFLSSDSPILGKPPRLNEIKWSSYPAIDTQNKEVDIYIVAAEEIIDWIETHDSRFYNSITRNCYVFAEEMEVWFLLRWS